MHKYQPVVLIKVDISILVMGIILDGNAEYVAHVKRTRDLLRKIFKFLFHQNDTFCWFILVSL